MDEQGIRTFLVEKFITEDQPRGWLRYRFPLLTRAAARGIASTASLHRCMDQLLVPSPPEKSRPEIRDALHRVAREQYDPARFSAGEATHCVLLQRAFANSSAVSCLAFVTVRPDAQQSTQVLLEIYATGWNGIAARRETRLLKDHVAKQLKL